MLLSPPVAAVAAFQMLLELVLTLLSLPERMPMHLDKVFEGSVADWFANADGWVAVLPFTRETDEPLACAGTIFVVDPETAGTRSSAAIRFSRLFVTGGPWLVPLCSRLDRKADFFLPELGRSFLLEDSGFFPFVLADVFSGDLLFS